MLDVLKASRVRARDRLPWKQGCLVALGGLTLALFCLAAVFPTFPGDERLLLEFQKLQTDWLSDAALAVTTLGWLPVAIASVLAVAVLLWLRGRAADASMVVLSTIPMALGNVIKVLVNRPRPEHLLAGSMPASMSFPSGHAIYAMVLCGILVLLVEELVRPSLIRRIIQAGLVSLVLAMGASRVYLGVHWPSDIIGSYLFGILALVGLFWFRCRLAHRRG